jgi:hypothetical protein
LKRAIVLLFGGLTVFGYFNERFHIASRVTIFRFFLNLRYSREIFNSYMDLPKQEKV